MATPAAAMVQDTVVYDVRFPNAVHHEAEISITYRNLPSGPLELRMSRSSPGRYAVHEFAKNVYSVRADDGAGRALAIERSDPYGWNVTGHGGTVHVTYTLFADRADGTYAGIDRSHAHLNMPATFMFARSTADRPIRVTFEPATGSDWRVATQLAPTSSPTTFTAPDLQYFMDSPTELSDFDLREWKVSSGEHSYTIRLAVHHNGTAAELDAYTEMAKKVTAEQAALFGEYPAFDYGTYTFIACYVPWASGDGMEHRNSTSLTSTAPIGSGAAGNLGTLSHEFFHAWNMERIRSRALEPFDFERANMSRELWFGEGFTSYYDDLFIRRSGLLTDQQYMGGLAGMISTVTNAPGRLYHSPVEMSMQAPFTDAATSIDPVAQPNIFISYYTYGSAVALGLDMTLRTRFPGRSLDDLMLAMWTRHGRPEVPYTLDDIRNALADVTGDRAFADDFFDRYITGREIVDYAALLANAGVAVRKANPGAATLGQAGLQLRNGRVTFAGITLVGTPWYMAGLDSGDQILTLEGVDITSLDQIARITAAHRPGDTVPITFLQRGQTRTATITFVEDPRLVTVPFEQAGMPVTDAIRQLRADWLASKVTTR
jgi:predicted metalloprotease with PDZ domain